MRISNWTIRKKTFLILLLQILVMSLMTVVIIYGVMLTKIVEMEERAVENQLLLAKSAIENQLDQLDQLAFDWAVWDDTYHFIQGENENYISSNITVDTLLNLDLDFMTFLSENQVIQHSFGISENGQELLETKLFQQPEVETIIESLQNKNNPSSSGLVSMPKGILLISMRPIVQSNGDGPEKGYIIVGRFIDEKLCENVSKQTLLSLAIESVNGENSKGSIQVLSKNSLVGETFLDDIADNPTVKLSISFKRELYNIGKSGIDLLLPAMLLGIAIFGAFIFSHIDRNVLTRLKKLSENIKSVQSNKEICFSHKETFVNDEIGNLSKDICNMVVRLKEYDQIVAQKQKQLLEINDSLEQTITDRTKSLIETTEKLEISEVRFRTIVEMLPDVVFIIDSKGSIIECEGGEPEWLLFQPSEIVGMNIATFLPANIVFSSMTAISKVLDTKESELFEYQLDQNDMLQDYEVRMIYRNEQEVYAILRNITDSKKKLRLIEYLSYRDQLTGLYNRRFFEEEFNRLDHERNYPISILVLDVNGLKLANDAFGHQMGDQLLISISNAIIGCCRADEIVARMGGDEFCVILPKTLEKEAIGLSDRIKAAVSSLNINDLIGSVSVGYSIKTEKKQSLDDLLKKADERMYKYKLFESQEMREKTLNLVMNKLIGESGHEKNHVGFVTDLATRIGKQLNFDDAELSLLWKTAFFHDVGKIGVNTEILNKESELTEDEYEIFKRHSEIGYHILKSVNSTNPISEFVLCHHEFWNGNGYPHGFKEVEIPVYSRIIAVADAYDSMVHSRPYNKQMTQEEAVSEIEKKSGIQFDPKIVLAFTNMLAINDNKLI